MNRAEYTEMVEYVEDRFGLGAMEAWTNAARIYPDFEDLDSEAVWQSLLAKLDNDPTADFPPKPPAVRAATLERIRHRTYPKALPSTTEEYGWAEFCERTYGEYKPLGQAIREKAIEIWGEDEVTKAEESDEETFAQLVNPGPVLSDTSAEMDADLNRCEFDAQGKHHFDDSVWGRQCERCGRLGSAVRGGEE